MRVSIPADIANKVSITYYKRFNARGSFASHCSDLEFGELGLFRTVTSKEEITLHTKVEHVLTAWGEKYSKHTKKMYKEDRATEAEALDLELSTKMLELENILLHTLGVDDNVDWDSLKRKDAFKTSLGIYSSEIMKACNFDKEGKPISFTEAKKNFRKPKPIYEQAAELHGFFGRIFRKNLIAQDLEKMISQWEKDSEEAEKDAAKTNAERAELFNLAQEIYQKKKDAFEAEKKKNNDEVENFKSRYHQKEAGAVEEFFNLVLDNSEYPDYFQQSWQIEYREAGRLLVVEYLLPDPDSIPSAESYKYNKAQDKIVEKKMNAATMKALYDSVIYQICIRTMHEIFEADSANAVETVVFNGIVNHINKATGREETKVIVSVQAEKSEFMTFDLSLADPKETFKHLRGISTASLIDLTPIAPTVKIDRGDKRFIEGKDITGDLDESVNLASMHWEDFEHLIRQLFEQEFSTEGSEVKITQASADGGVDAVAFDTDPIRGGKIIIQAKRYTNVVGVSAVRDLYGAVMNEGAIKGILITTSDYGKGSYDFAKNKPLTLLNGSNLLSLLEKHGHSARINIQEAREDMGY